MNIPQKILTVLMMIVFVFCTIAVDSEYDPSLKTFIVAWVTVGIIYASLFSVVAPRRK